jgi:hypothetical protein
MYWYAHKDVLRCIGMLIKMYCEKYRYVLGKNHGMVVFFSIAGCTSHLLSLHIISWAAMLVGTMGMAYLLGGHSREAEHTNLGGNVLPVAGGAGLFKKQKRLLLLGLRDSSTACCARNDRV